VIPTEVAAALTTGNATNPSQPNDEAVLVGVSIPPRVRKYLGEKDNKSVLEGWLRGLDADQRQDFLDNLEDVIRYAEQNNLDVIQAVNAYKELKLQKYRTAESKALDAKVSRYGIAGGMVAAVMLIVALSLVLVMLAIERNTRPSLRQEYADEAEGSMVDCRADCASGGYDRSVPFSPSARTNVPDSFTREAAII